MKSKIALVLILFFCFCGQGEVTKSERKEFTDYTEKLMTPDGESMILLSFKYDIETNKLEAILKEYNKRTSNLYAMIHEEKDVELNSESKKNRENVKNTILELSSKYDIPKEILSSLIIDYIILNCGERTY